MSKKKAAPEKSAASTAGASKHAAAPAKRAAAHGTPEAVKPPHERITEPELRAVGRSDDGNAFIPDFTDDGGTQHATDDMAEQLGEEFVQAVTGNEAAEDDREAWVTEEIGGPFVETRSSEEFAEGTDESNPVDAPREPFPTANRGR